MRRALLLCVLLPGCCGVFAGPSLEDFQRSLSDITVGMEQAEAYRRLERHGLTPRWDSSDNLYAKRETSSCVVDFDGLVVQIQFDEAKKVRKVNFGTYHQRVPL